MILLAFPSGGILIWTSLKNESAMAGEYMNYFVAVSHESLCAHIQFRLITIEAVS